MRFGWVAELAVALACVSCTEGLRGVPMEMPKATGKPVASAFTTEQGGTPMEMPKATGKPVANAFTTEQDGLRVLWNGRTSGMDMHWKTWVAGNQEELEAVWSVAAVGSPPRIDFAKYVVLAAAGEGGVCNPKITSIEAEATGRLILHYEHEGEFQTCILVATRIARIVAVPRRILSATVVFLEGYAFAVPEVPFH